MSEMQQLRILTADSVDTLRVMAAGSRRLKFGTTIWTH